MVAIKATLIALASTAVALPLNTTLPSNATSGLNSTLATPLYAVTMCAWEECPYKESRFDYMIHDEGTEDETHYVRINECGKCQKLKLERKQCISFKACGRHQQICAGTESLLANRLWKDNQDSSCYSLAKHHIGVCGGYDNTTVYWPMMDFLC